MITLKIFALAIFLVIPSPPTRPIEQAFLQNNADILTGLFPAGQTVLISLPEPLSFADQVSSEQARFLFERIFSVYKTTEFFLDPSISFLPGIPDLVLKTRRWSFRNARTGMQYPFRVFFYLAPLRDPANPRSRDSGPLWKILEIRAEKI